MNFNRERQSETAGPHGKPANSREEGISSDQGISKGISEEVASELGEEGKGMSHRRVQQNQRHGGMKFQGQFG